MDERRRRSVLLVCAVASGLLAVVGCVGSEPERLVIEADVDAVSVAESVQIRIAVRDNLNTPVPGQVIRLSTDTPGTVLSAEEVVTGAAGTAGVTLTASNQAGENRMNAVAGDLSASLVVPGLPGPPAGVAATADPARAVNGGMVILAVAVTDRFGNPVSDVPVELQAAADGSALDLAGGETDNAGSLTRTFATAPDPGDNTVEVTVPGLPPRTLVVPTRRLSRLAIRPERAELVAGGTLTFEATGFDDNGGELGVRPRWTLAGDIGALEPSGTFTAGTAGRAGCGPRPAGSWRRARWRWWRGRRSASRCCRPRCVSNPVRRSRCAPSCVTPAGTRWPSTGVARTRPCSGVSRGTWAIWTTGGS